MTGSPESEPRTSSRGGPFALVLLLLLFAAGAYLVATWMGDDEQTWTGRPRVGVLPVEGVLSSEKELMADLRRYRRSEAVKALVVAIRSPGGTVGASQALYGELREIREESDRPVVAWIGAVGASGGYYVAMAADSVLALPGSITGSIGVIMQFPNAGELLRKVGLEMEVVKSGELKDLGSPTRPLSEGERRVLRTLVDDVYGQFVDVVATSRPLSRDSVEALSDGSVYSGARAARSGLVDRTGGLDEAVAVAGRMAGLGARPDTVYPPAEEFTIFDLFTGVERSRLRSWMDWIPGWIRQPAGSTPRLLYQWRAGT